MEPVTVIGAGLAGCGTMQGVDIVGQELDVTFTCFVAFLHGTKLESLLHAFDKLCGLLGGSTLELGIKRAVGTQQQEGRIDAYTIFFCYICVVFGLEVFHHADKRGFMNTPHESIGKMCRAIYLHGPHDGV